MRDKLIHGYFGVNLELVWVTVKDKLPGLKKQILKILKEDEATHLILFYSSLSTIKILE